MLKIPAILITAATLMLGCAASPEPFVYHDERDMKSGPGLFSKDKGAITIYSNGEKNEEIPTSNTD